MLEFQGGTLKIDERKNPGGGVTVNLTGNPGGSASKKLISTEKKPNLAWKVEV